jgi:hypothetical protein
MATILEERVDVVEARVDRLEVISRAIHDPDRDDDAAYGAHDRTH